MTIDYTNISTWVTILTGVAGFAVGVRKLLRGRKKLKERQAANILQSAKDHDAEMKIHLENRIHDIEIKVSALKENIEKDIAHLKESYQSEVRFLGQKIEELREQVHDQHSQLVALLTKMIDKD